MGDFARAVENSGLLKNFCALYAPIELLNDLDVEDFELAHARLLRLFRDQLRRRASTVEPRRDLAPLVLSLDFVLTHALISRLLRQV